MPVVRILPMRWLIGQGSWRRNFARTVSPCFWCALAGPADYAEALKQPVDAPSPAKVLPENWWQHPAALGATDSDIEIIKRQWGAFYGTDLELQLRRRGIDTIVLCGISTNIGVESTARNAWELGFNLVIAETPVAQQAQNSTITVLIISTRALPVCAALKRSSTHYDYIGLPQWSHPKWVRLGITSLEEYARHFNCVEGNTTLMPCRNRGCPALA